MQWTIPGTTLLGQREDADRVDSVFRALFLAGGLTLSTPGWPCWAQWCPASPDWNPTLFRTGSSGAFFSRPGESATIWSRSAAS